MSLNIGGAPVRKIYWGADEVQEVRQGQNLIFDPSVALFSTSIMSNSTNGSTGQVIIDASGAGPIDTTIYKRLRVKVGARLNAAPSTASARANLTLHLLKSDGAMRSVSLDGRIDCKNGQNSERSYLVELTETDGPVTIYAIGYQVSYFNVTGTAHTSLTVEFEAIS
jgi:hypothetical protein